MRRSAGVLVLLGLFVLVGSGCSQTSACPAAVPAAAFTGVVTAKAGAAVTFEVEQIDPGSRLEVGNRVDVTYSKGTERFLHVGSRYRVEAWGEANGTLLGDVAVAGRACSGGTWHADGTAIDTGLLTRDGFRPWLMVPLLGGVAILTGVGVALWRRHRWNKAFYRPPVNRPGSRPAG